MKKAILVVESIAFILRKNVLMFLMNFVIKRLLFYVTFIYCFDKPLSQCNKYMAGKKVFRVL